LGGKQDIITFCAASATDRGKMRGCMLCRRRMKAPPSLTQPISGKRWLTYDFGAAGVLPFLSIKFVTALLPLVPLGYMLGWMVSAVSAGCNINPVLIVLDCIGILLALWRCKEAI
jgi:hypothetical protein